MAKQLVSPVERHLDKAVLGVAGLILIGVVAKYFVISPNQLELRGERVTPRSIDQRVLDKAVEVRRRLRNAQPENLEFEPVAPEFRDLLRSFEELGLPPSLPPAVALLPEVPLIGPPKVLAGTIRLVEVVKLSKPVVLHGRSTLLLQIPEDVPGDEADAYATPTNWVVVSSLWDRQEQTRRQRVNYLPGMEEAYVGGLELQRRTMRPDGAWSDDDWEFVDTWCPDGVSMTPPAIRLEEDEGNSTVPTVDFNELQRYFEQLQSPQTQLAVLRPLPPYRVNGSPWRMPLITPRRDVLMQDDEYLYPKDAPAREPEDRYPDADDARTEEQTDISDKSWAEQCPILSKQIKSLLEKAWRTLSIELATQANNICVDLIQNPATPARFRTQAVNLKARADQLARDIERKQQGRGRTPEPGTGSATVREMLPFQQGWVYDGFAESLPSGRTYQYRTRLLLYNRYAGLPKKVADPSDAQKVLLPGAWSDPSDPLHVEPDRRFFVTNTQKGQKDGSDEVFVEMFRWFEGVWVKDGSRPRFQVGDLLADKARAKVPLGDGEIDNAIVQFEADAQVLDIDFDRTRRKRIKSGKGVKFGKPGESVAVVFVDSTGKVFERILGLDKTDPSLRDIRKRVFKAPKKVKSRALPGERLGRGSREPGTRPPRPPRPRPPGRGP